ncbi:MAG: GMC family oxidoreductase N-terminal domain-containing protein [Candidatus Binatia bacterium]
MILDTTTVDRDVTLTTEVCIVGSGAGGAVVAKELVERGRAVVMVEEGPYLTARDFTQREEQMLPRLYADQGLRAGVDATVMIAHGRLVGGSTVPSFCLCARTPRQILNYWAKAFSLSHMGLEDLFPYFERVEAAASVHPMTATDVNKNNATFKTGADRLGLRNHLPAHNRIDCLGCGYCELGCAYDRKGDALTVHVPAASQRGAVIIPSCRVEQINVADGHAAGVTGLFLRSRTGKPFTLTVHARTVVLAAGALGSPALWLRSQLPNPHGQVGRNLHLQPQVVLGALFNEEIAGWRGIPQSVVVDEFLTLERSIDGGYLLMPFFAHPVVTACILPGFGAGYRTLTDAYSRLALAAVMLHDRTAGRLELDSTGRITISYHLNDEDRADLMDGMRRVADIYFAAGAQRVILPFNELVDLTHRDEYRPLDAHPFRTNDPLLFSHHPQGTLRMGADPRQAVTNSYGEAHTVKGLFVADASVFPTSVAVPPQLSVMAFALRTAQHIADSA